ncbi:MAG: hypothetical protein ACHQXA_08410, partial [Gemmatimonadales bacterium]
MYIELTDHLRCPADHAESFLVLLPGETVDRSVRSGLLGCPVCNAEYRIVDGVVLFPASPERLSVRAPVTAEAVQAFLGLAGPGGYAVLVGDVAGIVTALAAAVPGVHFAAIDPIEPVIESRIVSAIVSDRIPFKTASLRGVVLGGGYGGAAAWAAEGLRAVLPGLRVVGA